MDYADLVYKEQTDIVIITLNRPEKRNVFSHQMIESLIHALETANQDDRIKAIVITGEGSAFCAGGDVNDMISGALRSWGLKDYLWKHLQRIPLLMEDTDKLLVAAVNGPAAGGGFDLALACDLRTPDQGRNSFLPM